MSHVRHPLPKFSTSSVGIIDWKKPKSTALGVRSECSVKFWIRMIKLVQELKQEGKEKHAKKKIHTTQAPRRL